MRLQDQLLHNEIPESQSYLHATLPAVPGKQSKIFFDHMEESFIEHRRLLLENYLKKMITHEWGAKNRHFLNFLGVQI